MKKYTSHNRWLFLSFFVMFHLSHAFYNSPRIITTASRQTLSRTIRMQSTDDDLLYASSGYKKPTVNWYPGHIAKAERQLAETLRAVDVVVEVRDARAPKATSHPKVGEWCAGRPRIVVMTHVDAIPSTAEREWKRSYEQFGADKWDAQVNAQVRNQAIQAIVERQKYTPTNKNNKKNASTIDSSVSPVQHFMFVNAKQGQGIHALQRAIFKAGAHVQERRERRGLKERPLRVGIIGYPNVGKSALINRILGRRRARTANTPGITRALQWIRVKDSSKTKKEFELLDSPGVIPAFLENQYDAALLAACNCIGDKAYDNQAIAAFLCEWLKALHTMDKGEITAPQWRQKCQERYGFDPLEIMGETGEMRTGEDMLFQVADNTCRGNPEDASRKILQDFRTGRLGPICLQLAPLSEEDDGQQYVPLGKNGLSQQELLQRQAELEQERQERAANALKTAKQQGLELPPIVEQQRQDNKENGVSETDIGKGMFDGW